jgi:hypothetical protein
LQDIFTAEGNLKLEAIRYLLIGMNILRIRSESYLKFSDFILNPLPPLLSAENSKEISPQDEARDQPTEKIKRMESNELEIFQVEKNQKEEKELKIEVVNKEAVHNNMNINDNNNHNNNTNMEEEISLKLPNDEEIYDLRESYKEVEGEEYFLETSDEDFRGLVFRE